MNEVTTNLVKGLSDPDKQSWYGGRFTYFEISYKDALNPDTMYDAYFQALTIRKDVSARMKLVTKKISEYKELVAKIDEDYVVNISHNSKLPTEQDCEVAVIFFRKMYFAALMASNYDKLITTAKNGEKEMSYTHETENKIGRNWCSEWKYTEEHHNIKMKCNEVLTKRLSVVRDDMYSITWGPGQDQDGEDCLLPVKWKLKYTYLPKSVCTILEILFDGCKIKKVDLYKTFREMFFSSMSSGSNPSSTCGFHIIPRIWERVFNANESQYYWPYQYVEFPTSSPVEWIKLELLRDEHKKYQK